MIATDAHDPPRDPGCAVAYVILGHKNAPQISRLVRRLAVAGTCFFLHIDRRAPTIREQLESALEDLHPVFYVRSRVVRLGDFSLLDAALRSLHAVERSGLDPAQTVVLSGQDYPIKSPAEIARRLGAEPDVAYVDHWSLPAPKWSGRGGLDRVEYAHVRLPHKGVVRLPLRRRFPSGYRPNGGSMHCALGRPHRKHVLRLVESDRRLIRFLKRTRLPEELYFQTALLNSSLRDTVTDDNLRYSRWTPEAGHPVVLGSEDLPELARTPALLARKFDTDVDPKVLELIDRRLLGLA